MKIAVVGSRKFKALYLVIDYIERLPKDTTIVTGGARGVDQTAEKIARNRGLAVEIYKPDWKNIDHPDAKVKKNKYGYYDARAGVRRNRTIVEVADKVVAFWDGISGGTAYTIRYAKETGTSVEVNYDETELARKHIRRPS